MEWVQRALGTLWPEGFVSLTRRCCTLRPCPPHSCHPGARERHAAYVEPPCRVRSRESIVGRDSSLANMLCSVLCQRKTSVQTQCSFSYYGRCADACGIQFGTGSLCMFRQQSKNSATLDLYILMPKMEPPGSNVGCPLRGHPTLEARWLHFGVKTCMAAFLCAQYILVPNAATGIQCRVPPPGAPYIGGPVASFWRQNLHGGFSLCPVHFGAQCSHRDPM